MPAAFGPMTACGTSVALVVRLGQTAALMSFREEFGAERNHVDGA
jgi:hypothetical protein